MTRMGLVAGAALVLWGAAPAARADGGFVFPQGVASDLAQTRQVVLLALHGDEADGPYVTYVLSTSYTGEPAAFAWIIPVPNTPTDVIAHETDALFDSLDEDTRPRFYLPGAGGGGSGFGCFVCAAPGDTLGQNGALVQVEARGQAGIFEWVALTSAGGNALLTWLNDNGFSVPATVADVLDAYIRQGMHFLALRIDEPDQIGAGDDGEIEIPPIQFTCETSRRMYPMVISQISAAEDTEVLIYVLGEHRAEAANIANGVIDEGDLRYDPSSPSLSNYESVFTDTIAGLGGVALITEYVASAFPTWAWPDAPSGVPGDTYFLTRMRTVMAREDMTLDFEFQDAASDEAVSSWYTLQRTSQSAAAAGAGRALAAVVLAGALLVTTLRWMRPWFANAAASS